LLLGVPERHELHEDSSFRFTVAVYLWMFGGVVDLSDVVKFYGAVAVSVKLSIGSSDNV